MRLFQKQTEHEKKEMIFEVLAPLAENGEIIFPDLLMQRPSPPDVGGGGGSEFNNEEGNLLRVCVMSA